MRSAPYLHNTTRYFAQLANGGWSGMGDDLFRDTGQRVGEDSTQLHSIKNSTLHQQESANDEEKWWDHNGGICLFP